jgi:hypothetical protein
MALSGNLPEALHSGFSAAMGQAILLPAGVVLVGAVVALFFAKPQPVQGWGGSGAASSAKVDAGLDSAG